MGKIIDITIPMHENMPAFPGDEKVFTINHIMKVENGDPYSIKKLSMLTHTGTHIDFPCHYLPNGKTSNQIDLSKFIGIAEVIEITDNRKITLQEIKEFNFEPDTIVLFKTKNSSIWAKNIPFEENYIYLEADAAQYLVEKQVKTVGIDYLSIDPYIEGAKPLTHMALLSNDIPIIEGLDLSSVLPGRYRFTCLPLKIDNVDGSPARAILEEI